MIKPELKSVKDFYKPVAVDPNDSNFVPKLNQADRVLKKFGGIGNLCRALKKSGSKITRSTVYRWTFPAARGGTNGVIPHKAMIEILVAARLFGVILEKDDFNYLVLPVKKGKSNDINGLSTEDMAFEKKQKAIANLYK